MQLLKPLVYLFAASRERRSCYDWSPNCDVTSKVSQGRAAAAGYCYRWKVRVLADYALLYIASRIERAIWRKRTRKVMASKWVSRRLSHAFITSVGLPKQFVVLPELAGTSASSLNGLSEYHGVLPFARFRFGNFRLFSCLCELI